MIISIWRYSHLALAVSASAFILILSITGTILAFDPLNSLSKPLERIDDFTETKLSSTIEALQSRYTEILRLSIDVNGYVSISIITEDGEVRDFYIHPVTGERIGDIFEQSPLMKFTTNLHRSLFLKSPGRLFIGISSFLLLLITITGSILIIKRQQGIQNFFRRIIKENFFQHMHTYLGRLSLIPIIIIAFTGVYLSLLRFAAIPNPQPAHQIDEAEEYTEKPKSVLGSIPIFENTSLIEIRSLEFPFSDDPFDYYYLSLQKKEMVIHQYSGETVSEISYPLVILLSRWSTILHTGQGSFLWSIILATSSASILFFMYSGFWMTFKRRASRIKNSHQKNECNYIILVGSETGSTLVFAKFFQEQLKKNRIQSYIAQLNELEEYPNLEHLIVLTATYGHGEAPVNAKKFQQKLDSIEFKKHFSYSVVGFGSLAYPDFCQYAVDVDYWLESVERAQRHTPLYTINNQSWEAFRTWVIEWGKSLDLEIQLPKESSLPKKKRLHSTFKVIRKNLCGNTFLLLLKSDETSKLFSGDLLAIYPPDGSHERFYSIGRIEKDQILISIKRHNNGICSNYLSLIEPGARIKAQPVKNKNFHFPIKAKQVIMISTGTGIAPFLGMLSNNQPKGETRLYWGGKTVSSFHLYKNWVDQSLENGSLNTFQIAYSREGKHPKTYVQDLIIEDADYFAEALKNKAVIMICGSLAMQKGVVETLQEIGFKYNNKPLSYYQKRGQLKMDCY